MDALIAFANSSVVNPSESFLTSFNVLEFEAFNASTFIFFSS
jgi:hypothetical protein